MLLQKEGTLTPDNLKGIAEIVTKGKQDFAALSQELIGIHWDSYLESPRNETIHRTPTLDEAYRHDHDHLRESERRNQDMLDSSILKEIHACKEILEDWRVDILKDPESASDELQGWGSWICEVCSAGYEAMARFYHQLFVSKSVQNEEEIYR